MRLFKYLPLFNSCAFCDTKTMNELSYHLSCGHCWIKLDFIEKPHCERCGEAKEFIDAVCVSCHYGRAEHIDISRSALMYNDFLAKNVNKFKNSFTHAPFPLFAHFMCRAGEELLAKTDIITSVPSHHFRYLKRGFNQSLILGKRIAKVSKKKFIPDLLLKQKNTPQQKNLALNERDRNVLNSFVINNKFISKIFGKNVLIVDDVYTTGATLNECAKVLKENKVFKVFTITLARTPFS